MTQHSPAFIFSCAFLWTIIHSAATGKEIKKIMELQANPHGYPSPKNIPESPIPRIPPQKIDSKQ